MSPLTERFDLSDVSPAGEVDMLNAVLGLARDVVGECAPDPGRTRIERMARYVVGALGGEPYFPAVKAGSIEYYEVGPLKAWRVAGMFGVSVSDGEVRKLTRAEALGAAIAFLRIVEASDEDLVEHDHEPQQEA